MQTYAVYLRPHSSLASTLSSDTLFGAICWGARVLGVVDDLAAWLAGSASPPFATSTLLPVWFNRDGNPILRFYPLPLTFHLAPSDIQSFVDLRASGTATERKALEENTADLAKKLHQAVYLAEDLLPDLVNARLTPAVALQDLSGKNPQTRLLPPLLLPASRVRSLEAEGIASALQWSVTEPIQHNAVDRVAGATVEGLLYYREETFYARQAGLWALIRAEPADMERIIRPALRYLEDTGIGGRRTVGKGHFAIQIASAPDLPSAANANALMLLSRYLPAPNDGVDLQDNLMAYKLTALRARREHKFPVSVSGSVTAPVYKRMVRMFEPGSVFPLGQRREIYGRLAQVVAPEEGGPVYQSGAAVPLFVHIKDGQHES